MKNKLTDQQRVDIIKEYKNSNIKCIELARKYNVSRPSICFLLKTRGVKIRNNPSELHRKYSLNENYFESIDSEDKAYFLGLLFADGCNHKVGFSIGLQESDKKILDIFKNKINFGGKLIFSKKKSPWKNLYILSIKSKIISNALIKLGCLPAKTLILDFPTEEQVPSYLIRHFIRGYLDGDGSINKQNLRTEFVSTKDFCEKTSILLNQLLNISTYIKKANKNSENNITYRLRCDKKMETIKLLDWIYKDATVYLERKYKQYTSIDRVLHKNQYI